jgi:hypothetical protein
MADDIHQKQPVVVTRDDLYRQVWETPMSRLGEQYGITGNGLAKICERLKVPYPPRGYWSKKAAGHKVISYQLPPPSADTPRNVRIVPTRPKPEAPKLTEETSTKIEEVRKELADTSIPDRLLRPHPIIAHWLEEHDRRKREARRERDPWLKQITDPGEFSEMDRRKHRILDVLFKALEKRGGKAKEGERAVLYVEMQGEKVELQIREKQKKGRRPLSESEQRWADKGDKGWRQAMQPTGKLTFVIKTYLPDGLQTEWIETDDKPLEVWLPDIVAMFVAAGPLLVEQRRRREEVERERQIAERRRYEEEQECRLDDNRWRRFTEIAQQQKDYDLARRFLSAIRASNPDPQVQAGNSNIAAWMEWAEKRISETSPLAYGAEAIFHAVSEVHAYSYPN